MNPDYSMLESLKNLHPGWKLLRSDNTSLIIGFLQRVFITPNVRRIPAIDLAVMLEDELFAINERSGGELYPRPAMEYLNEWAAPEKGWLRKFYHQGTDEPQFDMTPAVEKAIAWIGSLSERSFVGTESRLLTLFELLQQICEGSETDPDKRLAELLKKREEIDTEMARIRSGDIPVLDETAVKDRFQQFVQISRELLTDFREVEHNFRQLDRRVREKIALWEGGKGELLAQILGERDAIADSDQGRSFQAFWDFLMSGSRQEEWTSRLDRVLELAAVQQLKPDPRTRRIHYDWLEAGEHTQRTVAQLSRQLRRFLDDKAWLENRRIMDILHGIETKALSLRQTRLTGEIMELDGVAADIELPMERPLHTPAVRSVITGRPIAADESGIETAALYRQVVIDIPRLERHIGQTLRERPQVTLAELCRLQPLRHGLAELVTYLQLSSPQFKTLIDEETTDTISWTSESGSESEITKTASLPRVIFVR